MKIACSLIILVVGVAVIHAAKLRNNPDEGMEKDEDKLKELRTKLVKIMTEKRKVAPLHKSGNEKRVFGSGSHGGCHVHDFVYLFTSLPEIRDALFDIGPPDEVISIVEEMAIVFGKLQNIVNFDGVSLSPPL